MLLIGPGRVFLRNENNTMLEGGGIVTEGNEILEVGNFEDLKKRYPGAEVVDGGGKLIMPGFINCHHHIYSAFSRGLTIEGYEASNLLEVLKGQWWKMDRVLNVEDSRLEASMVFLESIRNGCTTIFDHHASYGETSGSLFAIGEEARKFGIKANLSYEITDRYGKEEMKKAVKENLEFSKEAKKYPDELGSLIGLHASFTLSDESMDYIISENTDKLGYHVHISEGKLDEEDAREKYGMSVVERWDKLGILNENSLGIHGVNVSNSDMDILASRKMPIIHNPESNMGNAIGAPDVIGLLDKGVEVGLGTDGFYSDMLEALKFANGLIRLSSGKPNSGFIESTSLLFKNNGKIASKHFPKKVGVLEKGAYADIIIVDYPEVTPVNANNINGHLLFGMSGYNVVSTISNGKLLMKDRVLVGIDEEAVLSKTRERAADFAKRVNM